jgi:hypothetical protein
MSTILTEEQLRALRAKHEIPREDKPASISDYDMMTEFLESVHFDGPVRNWRDLPELDDDSDE